MKRLLDPGDNYLKTEANVRKYIQSLTDSQVKLFYEAIEFTNFPRMLSREYSIRFKKKNKPKKSDFTS